MQLIDHLVEPLGWTLLHFIWQGLLIGLLHEVALLLAARRSPQLRYGASLVALLLTLLVPLATFAWLIANTSSSVPGSSTTGTFSTPLGMVVPVDDGAPFGFTQLLDTLLPYIVVCWMLGVGALSLRFGVGLYSLRQLAANAEYTAVSDWMREELKRLQQLMGIRRPVQIALSTRVSSPLVVGWMKPVIFLPLSAATGLDHNQIRMVLAHELAHLRRHDHFVNFLQVIVETVLFYHPAVHRISRSLRQEREQCCDDMAASISGNVMAYVRVLAQLEEMRQKERAHVLALGIAEQELYVRIQRLVGTPSRATPDRWLPMMIIGLLAVLAVGKPIDVSAPLFPDFLASSVDRRSIPLMLPVAESREFRPIVAAVEQDTAASIEIEHREADSTHMPASTTDNAQPAPAITLEKSRPKLLSEPAPKVDVPAVKNAAAESPATQARGERETGEMMEVPARESSAEMRGGRLLHAVEPVYPRRALRAAIEGEVLVEFTITAEGKVTDAQVAEAMPRGLFETAALRAIQQWRFDPFMQNNKPVTRRVSQVMEFRLAESGRRGGTTGAGDCKEQTGTRLCRGMNSDVTELRILKD